MSLFIACGCATSPSSENHFSVPDLTNWHKESGIRVEGAVSTSTIRLANGSYRIFYPMGGIKSAVSTDGLTFTEEAGERVSRGSGSDYDVIGAKDPDIVIEDDYWRMYYVYDWYGDNSIKGGDLDRWIKLGSKNSFWF